MSRDNRPMQVDIGHPKQHQYKAAKRHVVVKTETGWILLCTGTPATREYAGWLTKHVVKCTTCFKKATEATDART